jgi:hypothetical protein
MVRAMTTFTAVFCGLMSIAFTQIGQTPLGSRADVLVLAILAAIFAAVREVAP